MKSSLLVFIVSFFISLNSFAETWDTICMNGDCFRNGWKTQGDVNYFRLQAFCKNRDCSYSGWTSIDVYGTKIDVTCKFHNCFKHGWLSIEKRINGTTFKDEASCNQGNCLINGWQVKSSYDRGGSVVCEDNNCSQLGGKSFWRSRRSITQCKEKDCYHKGWKVYFLDPAVPPTF